MLDSHVHFWHPVWLDYPWLESVTDLLQAFGPADYLATAGRIPVESVLFVEANAQPAQAGMEVDWVVELASAYPWIAGIVAFADLTLPSAAETLDRLRSVPLVRGIRHNIQGNPRGFCLQPQFVEGVREVGRRGLVFDLCATHEQLPEVIELVRRAPDTRFVLDHCGKPAIRLELLDPWRSDIATLASFENVDCKISGLLTEAGSGASADDILPYASHVVASFGRGRVMYGSDWPVLTLAASQSHWYNITRSLTDAWGDDEKRGFYGDNARRVYSLGNI